MLDGPPPRDADPFHLASIAAVVHALAARDGVEVPAWVHQYRTEPERIISGPLIATNFGRLAVAEASPARAAWRLLRGRRPTERRPSKPVRPPGWAPTVACRRRSGASAPESALRAP